MMQLVRIVDLETTGLDPRVDRVCEVATIDVHVDVRHTSMVELQRRRDG